MEKITIEKEAQQSPVDVEQWYKKWMANRNKTSEVVTVNVLDMLKDFAATVSKEEREDGWIKIEDGLPPVNEKFGESEYLLCLLDNNTQVVCWYMKDMGWKVAHHLASGETIDNVTHYRPLPSPPKQ